MEASTHNAVVALAAECGCSAHDMMSMAVGVAKEIEAMRSVDYFIAHQEMRVELCVIGLEEHAKKFERLASAYRSYPDFRNNVRRAIFHSLSEKDVVISDNFAALAKFGA